MGRKELSICFLMALLGLADFAQAQTISFETIPGVGSPSDGMTISDQFLVSDGVSFSLEGGGFPVLAEVGLPQTAFAGFPGDTGPDTPDPGESVGSFFLTDDGLVSGIPDALIIDYAESVSAASGVIIDIDNEEAWNIEALNSSIVIDTVILDTSSPNSGDGLATAWSFDHPSADIETIRIEFTGNAEAAGGNVGLAFDNFSPSMPASSPVPSLSTSGRIISVLTLAVAASLTIQRRRWARCC